MPGIRPRSTAPRERGAAAVEFALVAPLLLLIVFAIVSYGVMFSFRQGLSQAAAEGARAAALAPASPTDPAVHGAAAKARVAVASALGSGYSCTGAGVLTRNSASVGSCEVITPASCTTACTYTVRLTYRYADHPLVPRFPFVPMPDQLVYASSAQGNS